MCNERETLFILQVLLLLSLYATLFKLISRRIGGKRGINWPKKIYFYKGNINEIPTWPMHRGKTHCGIISKHLAKGQYN